MIEKRKFIICRKNNPYRAVNGEIMPNMGVSFPSHLVDISFDTRKDSDLVKHYLDDIGCKYSEIYNPNNGHRHFIFKKRGGVEYPNGADFWCSLGVKCDVHQTADWNKRQFTFMMKPAEAVPRELIEVDNEDYPPFSVYKTKGKFVPASDTDLSRNDWLWRVWKPFLAKAGATEDEYHRTARVINDYMFSAGALSDYELEHTVLRAGAWNDFAVSSASALWRRYDDKGRCKIDTYALAKYIVEECSGATCNGELILWVEDRWVSGASNIIVLIKEKFEMTCTRKESEEVYKWVSDLCVDTVAPCLNWQWVGFKNKVVNVITGESQDYSREFYVPAVIPWDYDPTVKSRAVEQWLTNLADGKPEVYKLLLQMIGYIFIRRNEFRKAFYIYSEAGCGKSTFLKVLKSLVGNDNCSVAPVTTAGGNFSLADIPNKLLIINDDIHVHSWSGAVCENVKKIVTGDPMYIDRKYKNGIMVEPTAKLFVTSNEKMLIGEPTGSSIGAVLDRFIVIPLVHRFSDDEGGTDEKIVDKIVCDKNMTALINLGIGAVLPIIEGDAKWCIEGSVSDAMQDTQRNNSDAKVEFVKGFEIDELVGQRVSDIAREYIEYMLEEENVQVKCSSRAMGDAIRKVYPQLMTRNERRIIGTKSKVCCVVARV